MNDIFSLLFQEEKELKNKITESLIEELKKKYPYSYLDRNCYVERIAFEVEKNVFLLWFEHIQIWLYQENEGNITEIENNYTVYKLFLKDKEE